MGRRFGGSCHEGHRGAPPSSWFGGSRGVSGPREVIVLTMRSIELFRFQTNWLQRVKKTGGCDYIYNNQYINI